MFEERSYEGLAQEVANTIYKNTAYYEQTITDIAKTKPIIGFSKLNKSDKRRVKEGVFDFS